MRKTLSFAALAAVLLLSLDGFCANAAPVSSDDGGSVVIVFRDGHKQSIPVSAIAAMQFESASGIATPITIPTVIVPSKRHFVGKWLVGDGGGHTFSIVLAENGEATKSTGAGHGTWIYVEGEARVSWDDGWHDVIRKVGSKYEKFAYSPGKSLSSDPANVTEAHSASPQPI